MKNTCCCCQGNLLRHLNRDRLYWFCPHCRQEMPNPNLITSVSIFNKYQDKSLKPLPVH